MEIIALIFLILGFILALILSYKTIEFTHTMWKFKNRKKDGSEDKNFKYFD
jgi:heme/copper-type cytochrome/quinol oxidase subunit 2